MLKKPNSTSARKSGGSSNNRPSVTPENEHASVMLAAILNATKTVLVVEEDSMIREIIRHLLIRQGHHVLEAHDEKSALGVWEKHSGPIHLVLTEVNLSEPKSGLELAEILWDEQPELHVIFTSGIPMEDWVTSRYNPAVFQFLMKPFSPSLLVETVQLGLTPPEPIDHILSDIIRAY